MNYTDNASFVTDDSSFHAATTACGYIMLLVFLCSLTLSTGVLWALWKTKQLQSPVYRMVAYVLLDEVLVRIFGSPLALTSMLAGRWLYGDFGCVFYAFWMTWLGVTSTSLFTCVAVERYIKICTDFGHRITRKTVDRAGLICYLHGLVWAFLPLIGVNHYVYETSGISCSPDWSPDNAGYILGLFTVCFLLPVLISVSCYSAVFLYVRGSRQGVVLGNSLTADKGVATIMTITMAAFFFSWTAYAVIGLLNVFGMTDQIQISKTIALIPLVTAKTAGMWSPIIFSVNSRAVRTILGTTYNRTRECLNFRKRCLCTRQDPEIEMHASDNDPCDERRMRNDCVFSRHNQSVKLHPREATIGATVHLSSKTPRINSTNNSTQSEMTPISVC